MKAKLNFKSKRAIIVISIIAILAIIAGVSTYYFIKGNDTAGATNVGQEQSENGEQTTAFTENDNNGEQVDTSGQGNTENEQQTTNDGETTSSQTSTATQNTQDTTSANSQGSTGTSTSSTGTTTGATGNTSSSTETDATSTYEQVDENIVVENPWEAHQVEWTPEELMTSVASVDVNQKNLTISKEATSSTGYNAVSVGDKITYKITVTNNEDKILNSLYIRDQIPEGTKFVSIEETGTTIKNEQGEVTEVVWNLWNLGLETGETKMVSFTVEVTKDAKTEKTIKNIAQSEGESSEETKNPVLDSNKTHTIKRNGTVVQEPAKVGDEIEYTISVTNLGEVAGTTTIQDSKLEQILTNATLVDNKIELIMENNTETKTVQELEDGFKVEIPANTTAKVVFTIKVKSINGTIENDAVIGGSSTITDETDTINWNIVKTSALEKLATNSVEGKAERGDIIKYTIKITNNGSIDLTDFKVEDELLKWTGSNEKTVTILAGSSEIISGEYEVQQSDINAQETIYNTAVGKYGDEEKPGTDDGQEVVEKAVYLSVNKQVSIDNITFSDSVSAGTGDTAYYKITITNNSNVSVTVSAKDILTSAKVDGTDEVDKLQLTYEDGTPFASTTMSPDDKELILYTSKEITQTIVNEVNTLTNTVKITGTTEDGENITPYPDTATVEVKKPNIVVSKQSSVDENTYLQPNDEITYTITIENKGETSGDIEIKDTLPDEVEKQSDAVVVDENSEYITLSTTTQNNQTVITGKVTSLPENKTIVINYTVKVKDITENQATQGVEFKNGVYKNDSETPESEVSNKVSKPVITSEKSSTVNTSVENDEDPTTKKVNAGDEITYTMTVKNTGLVSSDTLTIEDILPEGVTIKTDDSGNKVITGIIKDINASEGSVETSITLPIQTEITVDEVIRTKLTWNNIVLGANQEAVLTVTVTVNEIGENVGYTAHIDNNSVKVTEPNGNTTSNDDPTDYKVVEPNIIVEKNVANKSGENEYTIITEDVLETTSYAKDEIVYYAITVTNNGTDKGFTVVTDTLPTGIEYIDAENVLTTDLVNFSDNKVSWTVNNLEANGGTRTIYIKAQVTSEAFSGDLANSEIIGKDIVWWDTENSSSVENKQMEKQNKIASLNIRIDGEILENNQDTSNDVDLYISNVGVAELTSYNVEGKEGATTSSNAIKVGTDTVPTTAEEYAMLNKKIFDYVVTGSTLEQIQENMESIQNDMISAGKLEESDKITFDPETQMIVCYVLKYDASDGYHIDAVIRDKEQVRIDTYRSTNCVATTNNTSTDYVTINISKTTKIKSNITVVSTTTTTTTKVESQRAILVLDFSSSMSGDKIKNLKEAVEDFEEAFLVNGNSIKIIEYDANILKETNFETTKEALDISSDEVGSGTNIDYGLTRAYESLKTNEDRKNTSVILMTDGTPYNYLENGKSKKDNSDNHEIAIQHAKDAADLLKAEDDESLIDVEVYTVGFKLDKDAQKNLMKYIATDDEHYYETSDGEALSEAFKTIATSIVTTVDGDSKSVSTEDGIITMTQEEYGFVYGQNIEIYIGEYTQGTSTPYATYTWDYFFNSLGYTENEESVKYATYDADKKEIIFNLGKYMENENIDENESITIRFIDPSKEEGTSETSLLNMFISLDLEIAQEVVTKTETVTVTDEIITENTLVQIEEDVVEEVVEKIEEPENIIQDEEQIEDTKTNSIEQTENENNDENTQTDTDEMQIVDEEKSDE